MPFTGRKETMSEEKPIADKKYDRQIIRNIDGIKVTANIFFAENGKTLEQIIEDYIVKQAVKEALKADDSD